jgi:hypothetical protein
MAELTSAQKQALKAHVQGDGTLLAMYTANNYQELADALNALASPDFWGWKTRVTQAQFTDETSVDATTFSWTAYIARSQGERDAWRELFSLGYVNPSLAQVRAAFSDIYSGGTGSAQRTHLATIARRKATRAEKVLATGTGGTGSPATFGWEGAISAFDIYPFMTS